MSERGQFAPPSSLPADLSACPAPNDLQDPGIRQADYQYDRLLNLVRSEKDLAGSHPVETYAYDELQRLVQTTRTLATGTETDFVRYDDLGNIVAKSDYSVLPSEGVEKPYTYGDAARSKGRAGPHAVLSVVRAGGGTATFAYDGNGNMVSGDGRTIEFDLLDRAVGIIGSGGAGQTTTFAYGPDGARYRQTTTGPSPAYGLRTVYYLDKDYELTVWAPGGTTRPQTVLEERVYVSGSVVLYRRRTGTEEYPPSEARFVHVDRLGSVDAVTRDDVQATEFLVDAHGYDPWGKPRRRDWTSSGGLHHQSDWDAADGVTTDRGFTGHEHVDAQALIHMNGRVYDYRLGRFLSVDPIISNPADSQSINPYSYIGNNPLSGTDPTGYCPEGKSAETGTRICSPTLEGTMGKIGEALKGGALTAKSTFEEAAKEVGASVSMVKDALTAGASAFKSMLGISNGGGTNNQGAGVNNTNTTVEGSPAQNASRSPGGAARSAPSLLCAHCAEPPLERLKNLANVSAHGARLDPQVHTDLEALAMTAEYAASLHPNDPDSFVNSLGLVIAGVGLETLRSPQIPLSTQFGQTGFAPEYQEPQFGPGNNQARHFVGFVVAGYATGDWPGGLGVAAMSAANVMREAMDARLGTGTWPDVRLGQAGISMGYDLRLGILTPTEAGRWIRSNVGRSP